MGLAGVRGGNGVCMLRVGTTSTSKIPQLGLATFGVCKWEIMCTLM